MNYTEHKWFRVIWNGSLFASSHELLSNHSGSKQHLRHESGGEVANDWVNFIVSAPLRHSSLYIDNQKVGGVKKTLLRSSSAGKYLMQSFCSSSSLASQQIWSRMQLISKLTVYSHSATNNPGVCDHKPAVLRWSRLTLRIQREGKSSPCVSRHCNGFR